MLKLRVELAADRKAGEVSRQLALNSASYRSGQHIGLQGGYRWRVGPQCPLQTRRSWLKEQTSTFRVVSNVCSWRTSEVAGSLG